MKELLTKPLNEEELSKADGGVTIGSPILGHYRCYYCGSQDFHVLYATANSVRVECKTCHRQSTVGEN